MSLGEAVIDIGANTSKFKGQVESGVDSSLSSASKSMKNLGKGMTSMGQKMALGITAPLAGIAAASIKTATEFETSMNVLQAATGMPDKAMAQMEQQAIDLGAKTVFSANEAVEAMVELGKAGFSAAKINEAVPAVMDLAATEGLALADSAGIVSSALSQFELAAGDAGQVVNASRSSFGSLSESFKMVGSAAHAVGMSVQETSGALAALSDNGLDGTMAGTALAGVFNRLVPQTKQAEKAMEALGLNFTNSKGEFDDMATIAGKLQDRFKGMDAESRKIAIGKIFGRNASTIATVNALINTGAQGIRDYTKASSDQSAAANLADARMKGLGGAVESMKGSIENIGLVLGTAMIPLLQKGATFVQTLADRFVSLSPTMQKVVLVVGAIAAAIGPVLVVTGMLISSIGTIAGVFAGLTAAAAAPIAAFALIAVGVGLLLAKSEAARAVVVDAFNQIKTAVVEAAGPIIEMVQGQMLPAFQSMWPIIEKVGVVVLKVFAGAVVGAVKGAIQAISGIVKIVTGVVQVVSGLLTGDWSRAWEGIKNIVSGVLSTVIGLIRVWLNVGLLSIFRRGFGLLKGVVTGGWNTVKGLFAKGTSALGSVVKKVGNLILAPHRMAFNVLKGLVRTAWNAIKGIFSGSLGAIGGVLRSAVGVWSGIVRGALNTVKGIFTGGWNAVKGATSAAWNGIKAAVSNGIAGMMGIVRTIKGKITGAFAGAIGWLKSAGGDIIRGLGAGIDSARDWLRGKIEALSGWIPGWIKRRLGIASPAKALIPVGYEVPRGLAVGVLKGAVVLYDSIGQIVDQLGTPLGAIKDLVIDLAGAVNRSFEDIDAGPAVTRLTEQFAAVGEAITANSESTLAQQQKAAEREYAAEQKRLRKKYDGKDEKKKLDRKLAALEKAHKAHLRQIEKDERDSAANLQRLALAQRNAIMEQAAQWDALDVQLQGVRDSYAEAVADLTAKTDEMKGLALSVADSLRQSVWGMTSDDLPPTFDSIVSSLLDQEAAAKRYGAVMAELAGLGLNETSFQQIADEGVNGLAAAEALLAQGRAGVDQVNELQASINSYAQTAGDTVAKYLLGAGVTLAQSTVDSFAAQESTLVAQMSVLGQAIAGAFATAMSTVSLPEAAGGGKGGTGKHAWVPIGKNNRKCSICGKPRSAAVHTNRNDNNASGTMSASGGWTRVGERGPELVRLPAGSRVYPAHQSERMEKPSGEPIEIHVHMPTGDPEAAAEAVMNRLARRGR